MPTVNDNWLRLVGVSLMMVLNYLSNGYWKQPLTGPLIAKQGLALLTIVAFWEAGRFLILFFRRKYPTATGRRLVTTVLVGTGATAVLLRGLDVLRHLLLTGSLENIPPERTASITINHLKVSLTILEIDLLRAFFPFIVLLLAYEIFLYAAESRAVAQQLRRAEAEKAELEKAHLLSQLDVLKQQINPHFLFNSLNALNALIEIDPPQASHYLQELSSVYRYLLQSSNQPLTTLAAELRFIESYAHLLKTRFGEGFLLAVDVAREYENCGVPPLTLQLLVENAVKHNVAQERRPLKVYIGTDERGWLVVRNNLQRKTVAVASNGVGLRNIVTRYRFIGQPEPVIQDDGAAFTVTVPLVPAAVQPELPTTRV
ncbi:sensor histidine kinase [Tellurirhabdus rosea]|uniref:sensor histidine kinase n=1 Tax=Tellurirhabdus rosea TaxID=2674997 RepID=UPI00225C37CB|nr:histidine kinase [Tellurirhabdus rosea]